MSYFVHYVEDSTPKLIEFRTLKDADEFVSEFSKLGSLTDGYWVDFVIKGDLVAADGHYAEMVGGEEDDTSNKPKSKPVRGKRKALSRRT